LINQYKQDFFIIILIIFNRFNILKLFCSFRVSEQALNTVSTLEAFSKAYIFKNQTTKLTTLLNICFSEMAFCFGIIAKILVIKSTIENVITKYGTVSIKWYLYLLVSETGASSVGGSSPKLKMQSSITAGTVNQSCFDKSLLYSLCRSLYYM
jgi:hypothetical protein